MRISVEWVGGGQNAAPEERATLADLQIWIEDQNVTMHLVDNENESSLIMPVYSLAEGVVHDWWYLFGRRDYEISLTKYRVGYAVPDIRFSYDGAAFEVAAHQFIYKNPNVRFWAGPSEVLDRATAENELGKFIGVVLAQLHRSDLSQSSAALRWARIQASINDPAEKMFCEAAGALGIDPYNVSDEDALTISRAGELFDGEALTEFLAGVRKRNIGNLFDWIERVENRPGYQSRVADLKAIAQEAATKAPARGGERSYALGYRRARALRSILDLSTGTRFRSYRTLAERLGATRQFRLSPPVNDIRALRTDKDDNIHIHLRDHGKTREASAAETFAFARAAGDAVCFPQPSRMPINELHDAYRQAAGRAFAAEFLAPVHEVLSMTRDGRDVQTISAELAVSSQLVEHQIQNADRIMEVCDR